MSFETKLNKLVNKIYKNCVFRNRNISFNRYALDSRVSITPCIFTQPVNEFSHSYTGAIMVELKFNDDEPRAQETYEFFKKYRNVVFNICQYSDYDDYNVILQPTELCMCYDKLFGLGFDMCRTKPEDFEDKIAKLYLTHDVMLYDSEVKNNPGFRALAEHGFHIEHCYNVKTRTTHYNVVELTPGKLKEFFEDVYDKVDEVAKNPLYEEYKKYVIDELAACSYRHYKGSVTADEPTTYVYDFTSWKCLKWDADQELKRRTADAQKYIDIIKNRVNELSESK